jgi:DNA-binding response OmpR family regulator
MPLRVRQTPTSALIVEQQPAVAQDLADLLREIGFDTIWRSRSIETALRTCKVTPFDVAIIQLELGEEHGEHLVTALRAWPGSVDLVVAVCMDSERLNRAAMQKLPADAFLQTPLRISALSKAVGHKVRTNRFELADGETDVVINDKG